MAGFETPERPDPIQDPATGETFVPLLEAARLAQHETEAARQEVEAARHETEAARHETDSARQEADALRSSTSWRITAPVRWLLDRVRGNRAPEV